MSLATWWQQAEGHEYIQTLQPQISPVLHLYASFKGSDHRALDLQGVISGGIHGKYRYLH
jgi:hypothetical protein